MRTLSAQFQDAEFAKETHDWQALWPDPLRLRRLRKSLQVERHAEGSRAHTPGEKSGKLKPLTFFMLVVFTNSLFQSCEFCEKKFISRGTYLHHRMTHTGEKPHVCPVCNMGFIKITACKIHAKRHHGVIIPKGISPKVFIEKKMLNKHPEEPGMPQTQQQLQILTNGNEDILMAGPVPTATISPMPQ